jgi:hypothetical protein
MEEVAAAVNALLQAVGAGLLTISEANEPLAKRLVLSGLGALLGPAGRP